MTIHHDLNYFLECFVLSLSVSPICHMPHGERSLNNQIWKKKIWKLFLLSVWMSKDKWSNWRQYCFISTQQNKWTKNKVWFHLNKRLNCIKVVWCHLWLLCLLRFFFVSFFVSFFLSPKFIRHISRRLLNGNQWYFTGMLSTMSRCADYFRNFQNGRRWHGNGQNAKKLKNTKTRRTEIDETW